MYTKKHMMIRLNRHARIISSNRNKKPYTKFVALRKLFVQERRVWPSGQQIGWKRGEVFEVLQTLLNLDFEDLKGEWEDVGYYISSSFELLKFLYRIVTPKNIILNAVQKYYKRAMSKL